MFSREFLGLIGGEEFKIGLRDLRGSVFRGIFLNDGYRWFCQNADGWVEDFRFPGEFLFNKISLVFP